MRTIIGWPAPTQQNTGAAHGSALGDAEIAATKEILGFDPDEDLRRRGRGARPGPRGGRPRQGRCGPSGTRRSRLGEGNPERGAQFARLPTASCPPGWKKQLPVFAADKGVGHPQGQSGEILNALAPVMPELWGGSADLAESNLTTMEGEPSFLPANRVQKSGNPYGRTIHFGIREHAMGSIMNGIALHGLTRPYGGTFLVVRRLHARAPCGWRR